MFANSVDSWFGWACVLTQELCGHVQITGLAKGAIIFIESIARVEHLSLTGKILYSLRVASVFLVQWECLAAKLPRARYIDRLM